MNLNIPHSMSSGLRRVVAGVLVSLACATPRSVLAQSGATLEVTPGGSAPAGSTVTVKWSGPNGPGDYITVVRRGARPADYLNYQQTSNGRTPVNPVSIVLPAEPGAYEIRYVLGGPRGVLASVPYEVVGVAATIDAPAIVAPGATFQLSWTGPNNGGDWLTIVAPRSAPAAYGSYIDARTGRDDARTRSRSSTLRAPAQPGQYELRYVQQGKVVIGTRAIEVAAGAASNDRTASGSAPAGGAAAVGAATGSAAQSGSTTTAGAAAGGATLTGAAAAGGAAAGSTAQTGSPTTTGAAAGGASLTGAAPAAGAAAGSAAQTGSPTTTGAAAGGAALTGAAATGGAAAGSAAQSGSTTTAGARIEGTTTTTLSRNAPPPPPSIADLNISVARNQAPTPLGFAPDVKWVVRVANAGPAAAGGALLAVPAAATVTDRPITCAATAGAQCPAALTRAQVASGVSIPALPPGSSVALTIEYSLFVYSNGSTSGALLFPAMNASVTVPSGLSDPTPSNNVAPNP